jgi:hypothetical protein
MENGDVWISVITARSLPECQEKLMQELVDTYGTEDYDNFPEFVHQYYDRYNISIGNIKDIEEL